METKRSWMPRASSIRSQFLVEQGNLSSIDEQLTAEQPVRTARHDGMEFLNLCATR
jgi:hypothetical protein